MTFIGQSEKADPARDAERNWGERLGRSQARKWLREQGSEKPWEMRPGKGLWGAAMPRFRVASVIVGMR